MPNLPPNILYLHCHDAGRYIQPYGYGVETPHLQTLAEQGVLFRNAFCANPTCSPSRACLLTGQYAHTNGMLGLAHRGFTMANYDHHIVNQLRPAGYQSALAGTQHIAWKPFADPENIGYDEILTLDDDFEPAASAAEGFLAREHDKPFFLSVGFFAPHRDAVGGFPTLFPPPSSKYLRAPSPLPDTPETRQDFANYAASVRSMDACMGRVLKALERSGQADNTVVVATTDHGIAFPSMKCSLTDHGTGVMLIVRGPRDLQGGKVIDGMVSQVDIAPTLMQLAGLPIPEHMQGQSFLPLVQGKSNGRNLVFAETNFHAAEETARSVRSKRWKYIRRYGNKPHVVLPNCDEGLSKDFWLENGWTNIPYDQEILYDLLFDPNESNNLAGDSRYQAQLRSMRAHLDQWMMETDDPLLQGPLEKPEEAIVTNFHERTPNGGLEVASKS